MPNWRKVITSGSDASLNTLTVSNGITGSLFGTASYATQALSASFAPSTPTFPFTGSAIISGSLTVTGSLNNNGRINVGGVYAYSPTSSGITIVAPNESTDYKGNLEILSTTSGADNGGSILLGGKQTGGLVYGLAKIVSGYVGSSYGGYLSFWTELASSTTTEKMRITSTGLVGIGTTTPTAVLQLKAGTATANTAPLKLTAGTNLTTPEAGAVEFDGNSLFFTTGSTRSTILTSISPASITGSAIVSSSLTVIGSTSVTGSVNVKRTTVGSSGIFENNAYNLSGGHPIVVKDGANSLGLGYGSTAPAYFYTPSAGLYIHGFGSYGVFFEGTGFVSSGKCRIGDGNYNTGGTLELVGSGATSASIALSVQNSVGSILLKVKNDGNVTISGSLVAGFNPTPLAGTIQDGVTSVLGSLNDWNSNFYQGDVLYSETAGGTITFGQLCYRTQNETWELADATTASAAAAFNMLGICVKSSTSTNPTSILINGFVETAAYATIVKSGEPLYMSITPGSMSKTAPTTVGNAVRLIGHTFWDSNTNSKIIIRFNPESSWIEL